MTVSNWINKIGLRIVLNNKSPADIWTASVLIPLEKAVRYRYFIYSRDPNVIEPRQLHIRRWETHLEPRQIPKNTHSPTADSTTTFKSATTSSTESPATNRLPPAAATIDTFGDVDGLEKIDSGWLTTETIIQFKFFNNPFHLKQKLKNRLLYVKLTPMNLRISDEAAAAAGDGSSRNSLSDASASNSSSTPGAAGGADLPSYTMANVVTLKYPHCVLEPQAQFGRAYNVDDKLMFQVTVSEPDNVAYLIDLYTYSSRHDANVAAGDAADDLPIHLGYHFILPNLLRRSDAELEIPITCAARHRPLGMMNIEYLKVTPLLTSMAPPLTMRCSYARHWNRKWTGLDVGHRGSGSSFKQGLADIRENTIASLKQAAAAGADMVEFDVQLSKDLVPVIYHDFVVYVALKKKRQPVSETDMLELPMKELTLEQLNNLKVYHSVEGRTGAPRFFDEDLDEHQPFPQLADALQLIDMSVGFNIEVKWSMRMADGSLELESKIDRNRYVDRILEVVLAKAGERRIVLSCFDPDICTMLRFKQNLYPVMFLTQGVTVKYPQYHDARCNTIESAVSSAYAMEWLGIVAHTEDLLRDSSQITLATDLGLIVFCWGDDNNSLDTIRLLKGLGVHGVIYDKMDVLSTKEVKKSIFLVGAKDSSSTDMLRLQELEQRSRKEGSGGGGAEEMTVEAAGESSERMVLELQEERERLALSSATSVESLFRTNGGSDKN